jgi:hypothetical protein
VRHLVVGTTLVALRAGFAVLLDGHGVLCLPAYCRNRQSLRLS